MTLPLILLAGWFLFLALVWIVCCWAPARGDRMAREAFSREAMGEKRMRRTREQRQECEARSRLYGRGGEFRG